MCELNLVQTTRAAGQVRNQHTSVGKKALSVFGFPCFQDHTPHIQDTKMNKEFDLLLYRFTAGGTVFRGVSVRPGVRRRT